MQLTIAAPTPTTGLPVSVVPNYAVTANGDGTFNFEVPSDTGHMWITWPGYDQALYQWDESTRSGSSPIEGVVDAHVVSIGNVDVTKFATLDPFKTNRNDVVIRRSR